MYEHIALTRQSTKAAKGEMVERIEKKWPIRQVDPGSNKNCKTLQWS